MFLSFLDPAKLVTLSANVHTYQPTLNMILKFLKTHPHISSFFQLFLFALVKSDFWSKSPKLINNWIFWRLIVEPHNISIAKCIFFPFFLWFFFFAHVCIWPPSLIHIFSDVIYGWSLSKWSTSRGLWVWLNSDDCHTLMVIIQYTFYSFRLILRHIFKLNI